MNPIIITNKGKRKINQDYILSQDINSESYLCLIADGMGGYTHGEIAAKIVAENISTYLSTLNQINPEDIQMGVNKANLALKQFIADSNEKMGSTLGGIIINNEASIYFWVGDVKIFQFRNNHLIYESRPHSLMEEMINNGSYRDNARVSKYKHIVTRSIQGERKNAKVEFYNPGKICKDDLLVVCSDGVHDILDGVQIQQILKSSDNFKQAIKKIEDKLLVDANDNYSMIGIKTD